MIDFESIGYKDITKDKPIDFIELIDEFFEITPPYNKRFYKQDGNITIELKVGNNQFNFCFISGICYYSKGCEKFEISAPKDYVNEMFINILNTVKQKIKRKYYQTLLKN